MEKENIKLCLTIYVHEKRKHKGKLLYEWLLETAKSLGLLGGSAFRALAGFGKHGILREEHFWELASSVPVAVVFYISLEEKGKFLELLKKEKLDLFIVSYPTLLETLK